jgi:hypothetical protein
MNLPLIVQSLAIVAAAVGVILTIIWNRIVTRRRATLDMLLKELTNQTLLTLRSELTPALIFCFAIIPDDTSVAIVGGDRPPGLKLPPIEIPPFSDRYHVMPPGGRKP